MLYKLSNAIITTAFNTCPVFNSNNNNMYCRQFDVSVSLPCNLLEQMLITNKNLQFDEFKRKIEPSRMHEKVVKS